MTVSITASLDELYAFQYTAADITQRSVGWNFFDLQSEYLRMGVPNDTWVLSLINKDYEVPSLSLFTFNALICVLLTHWLIIWSVDWFIDWLINWSIDWLIYSFIHLCIDWSVEWLIDWFIDWFIYWSIDWLTDWLIYWFIDWFIYWSIDWLTDWLIYWFIDLFIDPLIDWLTDWFIDLLIYLFIHWLIDWFEWVSETMSVCLTVLCVYWFVFVYFLFDQLYQSGTLRVNNSDHKVC